MGRTTSKTKPEVNSMEELLSVIQTRLKYGHHDAGIYTWTDEQGMKHFNSYTKDYIENVEELKQLMIDEMGKVILRK